MSAPSPDAVAARAQHLLELERPDDALRLLAPALAGHPDDPELLGLAAHAHLLRDEPEQTVELAARASQHAPHLEWPHRLRSVGYARLGRDVESLDAAYESVRLAPFLYLSHLQFARALSRVPGSQARDQAWAEGRRAVELAPDEPAVHQLMADLAMPHGLVVTTPGLDTAEAAVRQVLALDPGNSQALNDLGRIQLRRGRHVDAVEGFAGALAADPSNVAALHNVGVVLHQYLVPVLWVVTGASVASLLGSAPESGLGGRAWQAVVAAALVGVVAVTLRRLRVRMRGPMLVFVRQAARTNRPGAAAATFLALAAASVVVGPLLPDAVRLPAALVACGVVAVTIGGLLLWGAARMMWKQWMGHR